jgi:hypothetical protein
VKEEDRQNDELLDLSRQILDLTKQVHQLATSLSEQDGSSPAPTG